MKRQYIFKRYELKYLITRSQQEEILRRMAAYMRPDAYGHSTICNLYLDTPHYLLIRRSLEKPVYKEKLRLRSYGVATPDSPAFLELKKKYASVVFKRRVELPCARAMAYLAGGEPPMDTQIMREIDYARTQYAPLSPAMFLSYERDAFYARDDDDFRITFDENILWRTEELSLCGGIYGHSLLAEDRVLMEIKTGTAIPLWMTAILSEMRIFRQPFSKYGNAYRIMMDTTGGQQYAGQIVSGRV